MPEFITHIGLTTIFLIIGGIGFLFFVVSFVVGDLFEMLGFDLSTGHDFGMLDSRFLIVEVTQRKDAENRYVFIINHTQAQQTLRLPAKLHDLLTKETVGPKVALAPNGVLILRAPKTKKT